MIILAKYSCENQKIEFLHESTNQIINFFFSHSCFSGCKIVNGCTILPCSLLQADARMDQDQPSTSTIRPPGATVFG